MKIVSQVTILCVEDEMKGTVTAFFSLYPQAMAVGNTKQEAILKLMAMDLSNDILS